MSTKVLKRALRDFGSRTGLTRQVLRRRARSQPDAVFIWIPKTAGTSLWTAFDPGLRSQYLEPDRIRTDFPQQGLVTFGHLYYPDLVGEGYVSRQFDESSFKFCFVRNPFDRTVSLYHYLKKIGDLHVNTTFRTFCQLISDHAFDNVGLFNHRGLSQCAPQSDWILDGDGNQVVDFIGRFENLDEDYASICDRLGINRSLGHQRKSSRDPYAAYFDTETRAMIEDFYAADFERFGY